MFQIFLCRPAIGCPFISALKPGQGRWNGALDSSGDALSGRHTGRYVRQMPAKLQPGPSSLLGPPHSPGLGGVCPSISALRPGQGRWNGALDSSGDALSGRHTGRYVLQMPAKLQPGPSSLLGPGLRDVCPSISA